MTDTSRSSVATTSTRDTPAMRLRSGRIWNIATSRRSAGGMSPVTLNSIMGKNDGVIRSTRTWVPAGRSRRRRSRARCSGRNGRRSYAWLEPELPRLLGLLRLVSLVRFLGLTGLGQLRFVAEAVHRRGEHRLAFRQTGDDLDRVGLLET